MSRTLAALSLMCALEEGCVHQPSHTTRGPDIDRTTAATQMALKQFQECDPAAKIISPVGSAALQSAGTQAITYAEGTDLVCVQGALMKLPQFPGRKPEGWSQ